MEQKCTLRAADREQGENIDDAALSHVSLLPFKHVLPNGTYFIQDGVPTVTVQNRTLRAVLRTP